VPSVAATPTTKAYYPRHPESTLLYRTVAEHFEILGCNWQLCTAVHHCQVQANRRKGILRAFVTRGHIEAGEPKVMAERASSSSHGSSSAA